MIITTQINGVAKRLKINNIDHYILAVSREDGLDPNNYNDYLKAVLIFFELISDQNFIVKKEKR